MVWVLTTQVPQMYETKEWESCEKSSIKSLVLGTGITELGQWYWVFANVLIAEEAKLYIEKANKHNQMTLTLSKQV